MRPLSLAELQSAFKRYLFAGDNGPDLAKAVAPARGIPGESRLDVYRNAYYVRLEEALATDFPTLLAATGEREFGHLAAAYLADHPSTRPSLRFLGEHLAGWLRSHGRGELADVAALEWSVQQAFDAPDAPALSAVRLRSVPRHRWPWLQLRPHPSLCLLPVCANVREVWLAVRRGQPAPALSPVDESLAVWRRHGTVEVETVRGDLRAFLEALLREASFAALCDAMAEGVERPSAPTAIAQCLHRALAHGWIVEPPGRTRGSGTRKRAACWRRLPFQ